MSLAPPPFPPLAALAAACAIAWLRLPPRAHARDLRPALAAVAIAALALLAVTPLHAQPLAPFVALALPAALLTRRDDPLGSECALKLLWTLGGALALGAAGFALLSLATSTGAHAEQWAVVAADLAPRVAWSTGLGLVLLAGVALLGGAPFHFWLADLEQGGGPALGGIAAAAIQVCAAAALLRIMQGIENAPDAAEAARTLLGAAALGAFLIGAASLPGQRHPERRVGLLLALHGGLFAAALLAAPEGAPFTSVATALLPRWAAHLALAAAGASAFAPFLAVRVPVDRPGAGLFSRDGWAGVCGAWTFGSLAGVPGTPGAWVWLSVARALALSGHRIMLGALALAWLTAFAVAVQQAREAWGGSVRRRTPGAPWPARIALAIAGLALVAQALAWHAADAPALAWRAADAPALATAPAPVTTPVQTLVGPPALLNSGIGPAPRGT